MTADGKGLGVAAAPSCCLVANVTKKELEAGPLRVTTASSSD
jgi:hypothetical protein